MKAKRDEQPFQPVNLILESQAEVGAIYAVLNHEKLCEALGLPYPSYESLQPFRQKASSDKLYDKISSMIE